MRGNFLVNPNGVAARPGPVMSLSERPVRSAAALSPAQSLQGTFSCRDQSIASCKVGHT